MARSGQRQEGQVGREGQDRQTLHVRAFGALLRLFPSEFRGDFGGDMAADFRDQHDDAARRRGPLGLVALWLRTVVDVLRRAPLEHLDILRRDASHAIRILRKRPASTLTIVLSLAIGIGLNTAVFSVVSGVLWRSLPFPESGRLVLIYDVNAKTPARTTGLAPGDFVDLRARTRAFSSIAAGSNSTQTIVEPGEPEALPGTLVTEGFFETLGVRPILGRTFTPEDYARAESIHLNDGNAIADRLSRRAAGEPLAATTILISQSLWQRRFLGRSDVIGQKLRLGTGVVAEIVGVMGPELSTLSESFTPAAEWWMPQPAKRDARTAQDLNVFGRVDAIARIGPRQTLDSVQAELEVVGSSLASAFPDTNKDHSFRAAPLLETVVKNARSELLFLFGAVLCVLLVTCVNVVHVFLANAAGRRVEFATRVALGATRAQLVRQTLTESAVLAAIGGTGGLLLASWGLPLLVTALPAAVSAEPMPTIPRLHGIHTDWTTFAFAAGISLAVALLCGLAASLPLTMLKPWADLGSARSGATLRGRRTRSVLTVCEVAIALMLVVGSMLMVRTIRSLAAIDLGFDPRGVVSAAIPRPAGALPLENAALVRMHDTEAQVIEQVRQLPGVAAAGVGGSPMGMLIGLGGVTIPGDPRQFGMVSLTPVSVGYFEALGARLKAGRFFTADDRPGAPTVAILGEAAARRFWPDGDALGKILHLPANGDVRIVGIVADMAAFGLVTRDGGIFLPHVQSYYVTPGQMLIRTDGDTQKLVPAIRSIIRRVNPETPFPGVTPLQEEIDRAIAPRRFILQLVGIFSVLGVALAMIGIYGVIAESVAERVSEIGVRIALGAQRLDVIAMILRRGMWMVIVGIVIGLAGAFAIRRQMTSMVYGVSTLDPVSYFAASVALIAAALLACLVPARRAARLDPVVALRTE